MGGEGTANSLLSTTSDLELLCAALGIWDVLSAAPTWLWVMQGTPSKAFQVGRKKSFMAE